nr:unnamed protein product [Digitaria exilis]
MGKLSAKSDYESLRDARISENMARMEMLGLLRCAVELSDIASASSSRASPRKAPKPRVMSMTPLRRSGRLVAATQTASASTRRRSARLNGESVQHKALPPIALSKLAAVAAEEKDEDEENLALVVDKKRVQALQERRCDSKARGAVYDPC